jgi:hypothetical protein
VLLAANEAVSELLIHRVAAPDLVTGRANGGHHFLLDFVLGGPTLLVGGEAKITVGDEDDGVGHGSIIQQGEFARRFGP